MTDRRRQRRKERRTYDHIGDLYKNLAQVANLSPRLVKNFHEMFVERSWSGNWVNSFLTCMVTGSRDWRYWEKDLGPLREHTINEIKEHHAWMCASVEESLEWRLERMRWKKKKGLI